MATFRGYLDTFIDVEADTEEEALEKMSAQLIEQLKRGETGLIVWQVSP